MKNLTRLVVASVFFLGFLFTTHNSVEAATTYYPAGCTATTVYSPLSGQKCYWGNVLGESRTSDTPLVTVLSPNGGETYIAGQQITINWDSMNIPVSPNLGIFLEAPFPGGQSYRLTPSGVGTLNSGSVTFTLPTQGLGVGLWHQMVYGNYYKIRIAVEMGDFAEDYSDNTFTILAPNTASLDSTPRVAYWYGKVNQHVDDHGNWLTDPDGTSGANIDKLTYCKKWYPNTTSIRDYRKETIIGWRERGNTGGPYTLEVMTIECVRESITARPYVTVLSPNGGESYTTSQQITIKWKTNNIRQNADTLVAVMDDRIPDWQTLSLFGSSPALNFAQLVSSSGTENVYQYTFTAPSTFNSTLPPQYQNIYGGNHYKILVNVLIGGQGGTSSQQVVEDLSDNNFAINPIRIEPTICGRLSTPSITVLAPNGGESYSAGQGIPVKWKTCNMPKGFLVTAQLNNSVANTGISPLRPENIVNSSTSNTTANDGQEIFYLPSAAEGATVSGLYGYGNNFRILLAMHDPSGNSWPTGNNPTDQSDNLFAINPNQTQTCHITNPSITVLSPNGGEVFQAGQQITLKWESCNIPATQPVLIVLEGNFNQGYQLNNLAGLSFEPNMLNDGIEVVTLPTLGPWPHWNLMQFGEKYKIKVVTQIGTASDLSDNLFTINDSTPPPTGEKVYIMGGNDNHVWTPFNDVWSSSEGTNWIQKTSNAQWSKRFGLTSLFYNNKIWIFGGSDGNLRNDVWSSSDGVNWTQVTANAPWAPRGWHTSLVFNNRMWIIGGASDINVGASLDDVWSSSDGVNWTQMTSNASWGNRAFHASMVFNNKMWVIGGNDYQGGPYLNDVWSSSDGVNWTQVTANAGWPARTNPTGLTYGGKIWIMGGNASFPYFNDVWSSIDGINWIQSTQHAAWSPRYGFPVVVLNNKMTIFGGVESQTVPNDSTINDVWTSSDGVTWTQMTLSAPWTARNFFTAVVNSQNLGKNAEHKTTSTPSLKETLRVGSKGEAVETLQQLLGIKVDGVYGQGTATKVKEWQAKNGLKADGAFGAKSWTKINSSN